MFFQRKSVKLQFVCTLLIINLGLICPIYAQQTYENVRLSMFELRNQSFDSITLKPKHKDLNWVFGKEYQYRYSGIHGTPFLFDLRSFTATIKFNGKEIYLDNLFFDLVKKQLVYSFVSVASETSKVSFVALNNEWIESISLYTAKDTFYFINQLNDDSILAKGFYELIFDDTICVYRSYMKNIESVAGEGFIEERFVQTSKLIVVKDGQAREVHKISDLHKVFPDNYKELKNWHKAKHLKIIDYSNTDIKNLFRNCILMSFSSCNSAKSHLD